MVGETKNKGRKQLATRLNILFLAVFLLFSALILRLGMVQIVNGKSYEESLKQVTNQTSWIDAPRGVVFDGFGHVIVDNTMELSVTYTNPGNQKPEAMMDLAGKLSSFVEVETENLRERDIKEYYYAQLSLDERKKLLADDDGDEEGTNEYKQMIDAITEEMISGYSEEEKQVIAIFSHMLRGSNGSPQRIKQGISEKEAHVLSEHLDKLPNIDLQRDSNREYVYGDTLRQLFGKVGSIQSDAINDYLAKGYERSDIVGTSFLEYQYEQALRGRKAEVSRSSMSAGQGSVKETTTIEKPGSRGNDLVMSIDMEYQQKLDEIVEEKVLAANAQGRYVNDASSYAIVMNPKTGDILAVSGFRKPKGEEGYNHEIGVFNSAFAPGSAIKAASVLTGFASGAMTPGTVVNDRTLKFQGTPNKSSVGGNAMGPLNYATALQRSSNVYMFYIAMEMAGYKYNASIPDSQRRLFSVDVAHDVLEEARYYFNQFGLGTDTGIDLPGVSTGYLGDIYKDESGKVLDYMIGQYDNYSVLQLGQYISTIANDGTRMKPRLVKQILEPSMNGKDVVVSKEINPEVLNHVDMSQQELNMVKEGMRLSLTRANGYNGTAYSRMGSGQVDTTLAVKTGTAQLRVKNTSTNQAVDANNQSLVGFAPYDDPEIAFAVISPEMSIYRGGGTEYVVPQAIGVDLINSYFEIQKNREGPEDVSSVVEGVDLFEAE